MPSEGVLRKIFESTLALEGPALLRALVQHLAELTLASDAVIAVRREPGGPLEVLEHWDGQRFAAPPHPPLSSRFGEPGAAPWLPAGARRAYPGDPLLEQVEAEGLLWLPLRREDRALGLLLATHRTPWGEPEDLPLLRLLALRAATELQRMETERALRQSEERLTLALVGTQDGLFDWNMVTGEIGGNDRLTGMLGYSAAELAYISQWAAITHPDDLPAMEVAFQAHLRGRTDLYRAEFRLRSKSGEWRWILDRGRVVERDARGWGLRMTGLHTDISERKQLEAQLQLAARMAAVGSIAAGLVHEINTPLTYLSAGLDILDQIHPRLRAAVPADLDAMLGNVVAMAREGAEQLRERVNDVKAVSRVDPEGPLALVDVVQVVELAVRLTRKQVETRAQFEVQLEPVPRVWGHAPRLGQVFLNLLVNAAEAIPPGSSRTHRVRIATRTDAEGWAEVQVFDDGQGIPSAVASRIFDPFFTTKPVGVGTGLGLSICHGIVTALQGTISFESAPGKTVFKVRLPSATGAVEAARALEAPVQASRRARLLVVDDQASMGRTLQILLADEHEVVPVTSGRAAIDVLETGEQFDLVLCDLMMPEQSGVELFEQVKGRWPALADRFLFMSAGAFRAEEQAFVAQSPHAVIDKPFDSELLRRVIRERIALAESGQPGK